MKIALSKKNDPRGRHLVLVCDPSESATARNVVVKEILKGKYRPVMGTDEKGRTLFRFNLKFLDHLALAFPMAELSPGIHRRLRRAEEKRLDGMPVPDLRIPGFQGELYDFQKIAVALITDPDYATSVGYPDTIDMLNDEMGLGKTFVALSAFSILRKQARQAGKKKFRGLLVVPNNAKYTWAEVIEEFFPKLSVFVYDTQEQSKAERSIGLLSRPNLTIVNTEAIRARPVHENGNPYLPIIGWEYANPELFQCEYDWACIDEHHRLKNPSAQATRGFFQLAADSWLLMSGTPILNRPEEIWSVLHKLYPEDFPSYPEFVRAIGILDPSDPTRCVAYVPEVMAELREFLLGISLRRRKDQVLKDLPEVIVMPRPVTLSREERKLYNRIEKELILEMEDGTIRNIGGALPKITRMKQACFSPELYGGSKKSSKIEELKEIVSELVASGEKALIFSQWEKACLILKRELAQYNPAYVTGKTKNRARQEQIHKFNNDEDCYLYIGTIEANREAINLGAATYVIFTDEGWTPAGNDQAIGRSAAGGLRGVGLPPDTKVHVIVLQAEDTYEQNIEQLLRRKRALFDRVVERDGGKIRKIEKMTLGDLRRVLSRRAQREAA